MFQNDVHESAPINSAALNRSLGLPSKTEASLLCTAAILVNGSAFALNSEESHCYIVSRKISNIFSFGKRSHNLWGNALKNI